jgi:hypothetical protein
MLVLFAVATLAAAPAAAPVQPLLTERRPVFGEARTACKPTGRYEITDPALLYRNDGKARMNRLGALPKANHEKAVLRTVDGCSAPVVVRHQVGR